MIGDSVKPCQAADQNGKRPDPRLMPRVADPGTYAVGSAPSSSWKPANSASLPDTILLSGASPINIWTGDCSPSYMNENQLRCQSPYVSSVPEPIIRAGAVAPGDQ